MTIDSGRSSTTAHVGLVTSGKATARITRRVPPSLPGAPLAGTAMATIPANPSQATQLGSVAGASRWAHGPAAIGSVAGNVLGMRAARAASTVQVRPETGTTASDR